LRLLAELPQDRAARLTDALLASGVAARLRDEIEPGAEASVWVVEEDDVPAARALLDRFQSAPDAPEFHAATKAANRLRAAEEREKKEAAQRIRRGRDAFRDAASGTPFWQRAPVCTGLIAACVIVALFGWGGADAPFSLWERQEPLLQWLWIVPVTLDDGVPSWIPALGLAPTFTTGQIWRLFTPALLHANPIHLAFNMSWLVGLGALLEGRFGWWKFLLGVLTVAAASNVAEFYLNMKFGLPVLGLFQVEQSPWFGGFSGVAVALFGFEFGRHRGGRPITNMSPNSTFIMLGFLFLCVTGRLGQIANVAHFTGLGLGFAAGFISAKREGAPRRPRERAAS